MMRRGRHLVPEREGSAPLIVYALSIRHLPSIARDFWERDSRGCGPSGAFRFIYRQLSLGILLPGDVEYMPREQNMIIRYPKTLIQADRRKPKKPQRRAVGRAKTKTAGA